VNLPKTLWRVVFEEGFGWPECSYRLRTKRTYDKAEDAVEMVNTINALPSHHILVGVYRGEVDWTEIDTDRSPWLFGRVADPPDSGFAPFDHSPDAQAAAQRLK
jgi:hypothetical protein